MRGKSLHNMQHREESGETDLLCMQATNQEVREKSRQKCLRWGRIFTQRPEVWGNLLRICLPSIYERESFFLGGGGGRALRNPCSHALSAHICLSFRIYLHG